MLTSRMATAAGESLMRKLIDNVSKASFDLVGENYNFSYNVGIYFKLQDYTLISFKIKNHL